MVESVCVCVCVAVRVCACVCACVQSDVCARAWASQSHVCDAGPESFNTRVCMHSACMHVCTMLCAGCALCGPISAAPGDCSIIPCLPIPMPIECHTDDHCTAHVYVCFLLTCLGGSASNSSLTPGSCLAAPKYRYPVPLPAMSQCTTQPITVHPQQQQQQRSHCNSNQGELCVAGCVWDCGRTSCRAWHAWCTHAPVSSATSCPLLSVTLGADLE